jgi:hypothetical protein
VPKRPGQKEKTLLLTSRALEEKTSCCVCCRAAKRTARGARFLQEQVTAVALCPATVQPLLCQALLAESYQRQVGLASTLGQA